MDFVVHDQFISVIQLFVSYMSVMMLLSTRVIYSHGPLVRNIKFDALSFFFVSVQFGKRPNHKNILCIYIKDLSYIPTIDCLHGLNIYLIT